MSIKQPEAYYYQQYKKGGVHQRQLGFSWLWLKGVCCRGRKTDIWRVHAGVWSQVTWQLSHSMGSSHYHRSKISFNVLSLRGLTDIDSSPNDELNALIWWREVIVCIYHCILYWYYFLFDAWCLFKRKVSGTLVLGELNSGSEIGFS